VIRLPASERIDLAVVSALSLVALIATVLPAPDWAKAIAGALMVFVLPGYAISAAVFLPGDIRGDLRLVLTVIFSIGCAALGGLVLQVVLPLDRAVFTILLIGVTIACLLVAARRRTMAYPLETEPIRLRVPGFVSALALLAAVGIGGWAIAIATAGQHRQMARTHFTALWMLPEAAPGTDPPGAPLQVAVRNHEGKRTRYSLLVHQGPKTLGRWHLDIGADRQWSATVPAPASAAKGLVVARLSRENRIYRRVALLAGSAP
jgi:hypothetical protein